MKRNKLTLRSETIRKLDDLSKVAGGVPTSGGSCACSGTCTCAGTCLSNTGQCDTFCICVSHGATLC